MDNAALTVCLKAYPDINLDMALSRARFSHDAAVVLRQHRRSVVALLMACITLPLSAWGAKSRPAPALDPSYVAALGVADRFLQDWQSGDIENGMVLLSSHAKESATAEVVKAFFSNPEALAYEITRGKSLKRGRYEFAVIFLIGGDGSKTGRARRRFSNIVVVNTGNNDWVVDKLP
jgi:hypothetical protein